MPHFPLKSFDPTHITSGDCARAVHYARALFARAIVVLTQPSPVHGALREVLREVLDEANAGRACIAINKKLLTVCTDVLREATATAGGVPSMQLKAALHVELQHSILMCDSVEEAGEAMLREYRYFKTINPREHNQAN